MLKLIVGLKGSGKTKTLIDLANGSIKNTDGSVICIEKGTKLIHEIKHQVRLIDTEEYGIDDAHALFGFVSGICASNHDVTDIFIDSALKICDNNVAEFEVFIKNTAAFAEKRNIRFVITSSIKVEDVPADIAKYI